VRRVQVVRRRRGRGARGQRCRRPDECTGRFVARVVAVVEGELTVSMDRQIMYWWSVWAKSMITQS